jgi:thiamine-monophosphate kinase
MSRLAASRKSIGEVGEFRFLAELLPLLRRGKGIVVGPGQDCAVLRAGNTQLLATVDAVIEGTHFKSDWMSPRQLGRRSFLVNASDIAAMGGRPRWCLVSVFAPKSYSKRDLHSIHRGLDDAAAETGACVVGGNLTSSSRLPRRIVTRKGARPGDQVFVTGTLGDAALGVACLAGGCRVTHAVRRYREPTPRLTLTAGRLLVESGVASAMIDVSDGLVQDLDHICEQSGVGAVIDMTKLPLSPAVGRHRRGNVLALSGGEDYELLCTVPRRKQHLLESMRPRLQCAITAIGQITAGRRTQVIGHDGLPVDVDETGFDHFA